MPTFDAHYEDDEGYEGEVRISYDYYKGSAETRTDPESPATLELTAVFRKEDGKWVEIDDEREEITQLFEELAWTHLEVMAEAAEEYRADMKSDEMKERKWKH